MGPFPGNERTWKPFNPILGETFELGMDNGLKFIAEQVLQPVCPQILLLCMGTYILSFCSWSQPMYNNNHCIETPYAACRTSKPVPGNNLGLAVCSVHPNMTHVSKQHIAAAVSSVTSVSSFRMSQVQVTEK